MRIEFADPQNAAEQAALAALDDRIAAWWAEFAAKADQVDALFRQQAEFDLVGWMNQFLGGVDDRIMWEFGPARRGGKHRLVITPESDRQLRPLVNRVLATAPADTGFEFYGARLPEGVDMTRQTVAGRTGNSIEDAVATLNIDERNLLELHLYGDFANDAESAFATGVITFETLLGEAFMERWVGTVDVSPMPTAGLLRKKPTVPAGGIPLAEVRRHAEQALKRIQAALPDQPCHASAEGWEWAVYKLQGPDAGDAPEGLPGQYDLLVASVGHKQVFEATHGRRDFDSERFSRHGEVFCYLKVDGAEGLEASAYGDRGDIEDALNAALKPGGVGVCIGGGTGQRFSYLDMALTELGTGVERVCATLREGKIPKRSWVLFFDAERGDEWVGVYPDTPPPPGLS